VTGLALAGCGGGKQPPPFKEVPQPATTTDAAGAGTSAGSPVQDTITKLPSSEGKALAPLLGELSTLSSQGQAVTDAAADAQKLADRVAGGYNPPTGSAPSLTHLRDALGSFSDALRNIATAQTLLPQLSARLQLRSTALAKRRPAAAAGLLTAKQRVDSAISDTASLNRDVQAAQAQVGKQITKVSLDSDALKAAITSGTDSTDQALSKVSDAVDAGLQALASSA
jgi:hypothetical protein